MQVTLIRLDPPTRINDKFVTNGNCQIDCTPVQSDILHPLIPDQNFKFQYQADFYSLVSLDIAVETTYNYPYPYITEKSIRPIACKRLFVVIGPQGIIKKLKDYGFDMFDDYISHSYDSIDNPQDRLITVTNTIKEFCSRDLNDIKTFYRNNQNRFDKNFKILQSLKNKEIKRLKELLDV